MSLSLGKTLDRCYSLRVPFLNYHYNINIFFNKRSTFLLFGADKDYSKVIGHPSLDGVKLQMFKNLKSSKFGDLLNLHSYNGESLDIIDQFTSIKPSYESYIEQFLNESIILSKTRIDGRDLFDTLTVYGFTINAYEKEFAFILTERQNVAKKLNKKIVRSTGIQIATSKTLDVVNEFHSDFKASLGKLLHVGHD